MLMENDGRTKKKQKILREKKLKVVGDHLGTIGGVRTALQKFDSNNMYRKQKTKKKRKCFCRNSMVWLRTDSY